MRYDVAWGTNQTGPVPIEQMAEGTAQVRSILGPEVSITDKDIEASLWHYYYDIEKTVTYLLSTSDLDYAENFSLHLPDQQSSSVAKKSRKATEGAVRTGKGGSAFLFPHLWDNTVVFRPDQSACINLPPLFMVCLHFLIILWQC